MLIRRLGNKSKLAEKIIEKFPPHEIYIEPFFGAGGLFFNKPLAKYNYLNDLDKNILNIFKIVRENPKALYECIESIPYDKATIHYLESSEPVNDIERAAIYLIKNNYSFKGRMQRKTTLHYDLGNSKQILLQNIKTTVDFLLKTPNIQFNNADYKDFLNQLNFVRQNDKSKAFIYCDPPYCNTNKVYELNFSKEQTIGLIEFLINYGVRFAVSEFLSDITREIAESYNLNIINICERHNLGSRQTEILLTNYQNRTLFL